MTSGIVAGESVAALVVGSVAVAITAVVRARRRRRLQAARAQAGTWRAQGYHLVYVTRVYQDARRGTKAIVTWDESGRQQDTWFWGLRPRRGAYLVVRGSVGYGPHNQNPQVLYLHPNDVVRVA